MATTLSRMEEIYAQNESLIKNRATFYAKKTGMPKEELISEGNLAFCNAVKTYNPKRGAFTTHLWHSIRYGVLELEKERAARKRNISIEDLNGDSDSEDEAETYYRELSTVDDNTTIYDSLSEQSMKVVRMIIDNEFTHLSHVTAYLLKKGYKHQQIQEIYRDIRRTIHAGKIKRR